MPRGDGTGPMGLGAMTGRAAGYCAGSGMPGYTYAAIGRGDEMGLGRGRGAWGRGAGGGRRGWRNMFYATGQPGWMRSGGSFARYGHPTPYPKPDPDVEKQALKNQAEFLQSELDFIKKRLAEVEAGTA